MRKLIAVMVCILFLMTPVVQVPSLEGERRGAGARGAHNVVVTWNHLDQAQAYTGILSECCMAGGAWCCYMWGLINEWEQQQ